MEQDTRIVLEGLFAVAKPAHISSADVLQHLQSAFAPSQTFTPLLQTQPQRPSKSNDTIFKMGHGGTLDPMASGVLIVGIGRGTKYLHNYLACTKSYETEVLFGAGTDTYDATGVITERRGFEHVTRELVQHNLAQFRGTISQAPPVYSALKINGVKACEYARAGKDLPRELEAREMIVDECTLLSWCEGGTHSITTDERLLLAPAARVRLTVSSGFYVRSFAHDLGVACGSCSHMTGLVRTRQAHFVLQDRTSPDVDTNSEFVTAIPLSDFTQGEDVWGPKLRPQLEAWVAEHPAVTGHVDGRDEARRRKGEGNDDRPRQRFRGGWMAETKSERIKQQGGKWKGKWGKKVRDDAQKNTAEEAIK